MRTRLAVTVTRIAARQLQNPAVQKALGAIAAVAVERFTAVSIERLKRWERRLKKYDEVVECEWWECPEKQLPEK
jgi:hypothetical protein